MITTGVDLAADARHTAVAVINWADGRARVTALDRPADDALVLARSADAAKVGIDCPLGWPVAFVDFVRRHSEGAANAISATVSARTPLVYRETDLHVIRTRRPLRPLSVSADRIGHAAMRCAGLLAGLAEAGHDVDRSGGALVVEVYPAASLSHWKLTHHRYKGRANAAALSASVDALLRAAPCSFEALCRGDDDAFDAVIAGLTARAAALSLTEAPPSALLAAARVEGWIALPSCGLADLPVADSRAVAAG